MKRAATKGQGFTLIELIVVIVIIGILATIAVIGFGKFQADTRDARRSSSANVITEALEKYYDQNGEYPSCAKITDNGATVVQNTLKNVDQSALVAPQASGETNSIKCSNTNTLSANGPDFFEYQGDGSPECNGNGSCLSFVFKYKSEADGTIKTINSRRSSSIATSGNITNLQANTTDFTTVALSWGSISNSISYNVQVSADNTFNAPTTSSSPTAGVSLGGLAYGTTYFFRVQPVNGTSTGAWSNVVTATTWSLDAPSLAIVANSQTKVTLTWNSINHATSYRVQRSTTSTFNSGTYTETSSTGTSLSYTDEVPGTTHYYRVLATASGFSGNPSNVVQMMTTTQPGAFTISESDPKYNTIVGTSNASCPYGNEYYIWTRSVNGGAYTQIAAGTGYSSVTTSIGWDQTVNLRNSVNCQSGTYTSATVAANNTIGRTLSSPSASTSIGPARTFNWWGTCPDGTTSKTFAWKVQGDGNVNASGSSSSNGSYANTGNAWGDGNGRVTLSCYSSGSYGWSGAVTASSFTAFGGGCVNGDGTPNYTKSICTAN